VKGPVAVGTLANAPTAVQQIAQNTSLHIKRAAIAISLADLCFLSAWQRRIYGVPFFSPLWSWKDLMALLLNVALLACILFLLLLSADKVTLKGRTMTGLVFMLPLFSTVNIARRLAFNSHGKIAAAVMVTIPIIVGVALIVWQRKLLPVAEFVALGLLLLFPFHLFEAARNIRAPKEPPALAPKLVSSARTGPRVVWLIFDEMDYALSFPRRPEGLRLQEFDRLRSEAFFATKAHQPASDTKESLPALIDGKPIYGPATAKGLRTLYVNFALNGPPTDWDSAPNVFSDARAMGVNVGLVGWYLPYCRIFQHVASECYWEPMFSGVNDTPSFRNSLQDQWDALTPLESRMRLVQRLHRMQAAAEQMSADPQLGLVLIHLPIPHGPQIFDRYTGAINSYTIHPDWFFDNVELADRVLGQIRNTMEKSGQWEGSAIIVSSDHSLRRTSLPHPDPLPLVPFLVKMPGQSKGIQFVEPFNTRITRELITAILRGEVTAENLESWIQRRRTEFLN
jgi:hypothetical protein